MFLLTSSTFPFSPASGGIGLYGTYRPGCPRVRLDELRGRSVPQDRSDHRRTPRSDPSLLRRHRAPTRPSWLWSLDIQTLGTVVETRLEYHGYTNIEGCMSIAFRMEVLCPKEMTFFSSARLASLRLMGCVGTWCHGRCFYPHMLNTRRERLSYHSRILNQVYSNNSPRLLLKVLQDPSKMRYRPLRCVPYIDVHCYMA